MDLDARITELMKFKSDMLLLVTREGTQEAFNKMVAERREELAERARVAAKPLTEPGSDDMGSIDQSGSTELKPADDQNPPQEGQPKTEGAPGDSKGSAEILHRTTHDHGMRGGLGAVDPGR